MRTLRNVAVRMNNAMNPTPEQVIKERRLERRMGGIIGQILDVTFEQIRKTSETSDCFKKGQQ